MTRKFAIFAFALLSAGCAQKAAPPPAPAALIVPIPPPPPRSVVPDQYAGMSADRLRVLMGSPAFIRKDGATEMWRYDGKDCHAYFFFYGSGAAQAVRYVQTEPLGKGNAVDPACLTALKKTP